MSSLKRDLNQADEFEPPPKKLVSNADLFIKELAKKQQNTTIHLHQALANPKEFCKGAELISLASFNAGTSSLKQFQEATTHIDHIAHLKAAGLVDHEINLYFDYLKGDTYLCNKYKNCEESTLKKTISRIENSILIYQEKQSVPIEVNNTRLGLLESESLHNGLSIKPDSNETKLYKFALENEKLRNKSKMPNPMDNIKQIEQNFLESLNTNKLPNINEIRRKARKLFKRVQRISETNNLPKSSDNFLMNNGNNQVTKSKWDDKAEPVIQAATKQKKLFTCAPLNYYTIKEGKIVKLNTTECQAIDLPINKLTIDEIKQIPKFQDYAEGIPSKVLYLKNLSSRTNEIDLKNLFKNYDKNGDIDYKIMNGKMRGQAFVTFNDDAVASEALNEVNGTFIRNKPVIIQFGRGKGQSSK